MNWVFIKKSKIYRKIKEVFSQGLSPLDMIKAAILGIVIGIMPIFGLSTILVSYLAIKLKLNLGVAIVFVISPLHPFLFIPFIHFGEKIIDVRHSLLTFEAIKTSFQTSVLSTLKQLWLELLCGLLGWSFIAIPRLGTLVIQQYNKIKTQ